MLVGKYSWVYNGWTLSVMCDEHNHPSAQHMEAHPYARRLTTDEYRLVEDLTRKNVEARNILAILKEQNKDNVSTIKDIYNAQSKIREYIPLDSVDIFWRTLNVSWSEPVEDDYIQCEDVLHRFKEKFSFLTDLNMQPTRHSSVSNTQTCRMHNLIPDLNEEPPRHSSFVSQTSMWHDSSMDEQIEIERFRKQIPKVVHPYILVSGIQNVRSDGNCGFRAVALGLGLSEDQWPRIRLDLVRELEARQRQYKYVFGTIGYEKIYSTMKFAERWMKMPDTGLVIASAYKKVVVNLSDASGCNTSFPLWSSPLQSDSHETIVVAHVDGNYYIRVALREDFPLPLTHPLWITYRSDIASG
ncbi:RNA-directed DNA polymerase, eukaryota [Tanacetum coccineum]